MEQRPLFDGYIVPDEPQGEPEMILFLSAPNCPGDFEDGLSLAKLMASSKFVEHS